MLQTFAAPSKYGRISECHWVTHLSPIAPPAPSPLKDNSQSLAQAVGHLYHPAALLKNQYMEKSCHPTPSLPLTSIHFRNAAVFPFSPYSITPLCPWAQQSLRGAAELAYPTPCLLREALSAQAISKQRWLSDVRLSGWRTEGKDLRARMKSDAAMHQEPCGQSLSGLCCQLPLGARSAQPGRCLWAEGAQPCFTCKSEIGLLKINTESKANKKIYKIKTPSRVQKGCLHALCSCATVPEVPAWVMAHHLHGKFSQFVTQEIPNRWFNRALVNVRLFLLIYSTLSASPCSTREARGTSLQGEGSKEGKWCLD